MALFQILREKVNGFNHDVLQIINYDNMTSITIRTRELDEFIKYLNKQKVQIKKDDQIKK